MLEYVIAMTLQQHATTTPARAAATRSASSSGTRCSSDRRLRERPGKFLRQLTQDLRMRDLAACGIVDPRRRGVASDALAIIAADAECTRPMQKSQGGRRHRDQPGAVRVWIRARGLPRAGADGLRARGHLPTCPTCSDIRVHVRTMLGSLQRGCWARAARSICGRPRRRPSARRTPTQPV